MSAVLPPLRTTAAPGSASVGDSWAEEEEGSVEPFAACRRGAVRWANERGDSCGARHDGDPAGLRWESSMRKCATSGALRETMNRWDSPTTLHRRPSVVVTAAWSGLHPGGTEDCLNSEDV